MPFRKVTLELGICYEGLKSSSPRQFMGGSLILLSFCVLVTGLLGMGVQDKGLKMPDASSGKKMAALTTLILASHWVLCEEGAEYLRAIC